MGRRNMENKHRVDIREHIVELHESLKNFIRWQEVARMAEQCLRNNAWNYTVVLRAMEERQENFEVPEYNTVQIVSRNGDHFEFAFDVNEVKPPLPHSSMKEFVDVHILQV